MTLVVLCFRTISRLSVAGLLFFASSQTLATATFPSKGAPQQNGPVSRGFVACAIEMRTDAEGVDFSSYLRGVYVSVKKSWFGNMPPSIEKGQQGKNIIEFRVLRDGNVPKDSLKMVLSSEKSDFDIASLQGIREAAPFSHLPGNFSQPFIVLRFTFYYNLPKKW
jgi:TonB family protein